ncbi:BtpA/SgcQ family protein [Actinacidiphila yeochonensis]|uniref:BtpA/SgcQ family protein n=1 Tax=Actinacidiphila yeochonensis TaxID=89050 RepID=UPI00099D6CA0|nr:BtpA/SgcQ family protein [Actinacidiphila yeochonensis]
MTTEADDRRHRKLYGVVHLPPLPGTPFHVPGSLAAAVDDAVRDAEALCEGGADGVLLQTVDRVYSVEDEADPARTAAMTLCASRVADATADGFELGVQIMRHAVRASLAVAKVVGASFVRADAIVGATLSTHGWVRPDPLEIMAYRRAIDAFDVRLIADVDSMHFRWAGEGETTGGVARRAELVGADAVCVAHPDEDATLAKIADIRARSPRATVMLGGFVTHGNAARLLADADGAFVSGCLTTRGGGGPDGRVDVGSVRRLARVVHGGSR